MDELTIKTITAAERSTPWQAALQDCFASLAVYDKCSGNREAAISTRTIDELCLSVVNSVDHACMQERSSLSSMGGDFLVASVQLAGEGRLDQNERSAYVACGDMVFFNGSQPFEWHFPGDFRQLVVRIPYAKLRFRLPPQHIVLNHTIPCASGMAKIAADYLMLLYREANNVEPGIGKDLASSAVDVIAGALNACRQAQAGPHTRLQALQIHQAKAFIQKNIRDPELGPAMVAAALGISVRYLHYLFNASGVSVGRSILQLRLTGCAEALTRRGNDMESISTIAYAWGFNSAVHFSRVFRAAHGMSASDYRALHAESKAPLAYAA